MERFDQTKYLESLSSATRDRGLVRFDVRDVSFTVKVGYNFGDTISEAAAISVIADATGAAESDVTVVVNGARRLRQSFRNLAATNVEAVIVSEEAAAAAVIAKRAADEVALQRALHKRGSTIHAPKISSQPQASIKIMTHIESKEDFSEAVIPSDEVLSAEIQKNLGIGVRVTSKIGENSVSQYSSSSPCSAGECSPASSFWIYCTVIIAAVAAVAIWCYAVILCARRQRKVAKVVPGSQQELEKQTYEVEGIPVQPSGKPQELKLDLGKDMCQSWEINSDTSTNCPSSRSFSTISIAPSTTTESDAQLPSFRSMAGSVSTPSDSLRQAAMSDSATIGPELAQRGRSSILRSSSAGAVPVHYSRPVGRLEQQRRLEQQLAQERKARRSRSSDFSSSDRRAGRSSQRPLKRQTILNSVQEYSGR